MFPSWRFRFLTVPECIRWGCYKQLDVSLNSNQHKDVQGKRSKRTSRVLDPRSAHHRRRDQNFLTSNRTGPAAESDVVPSLACRWQQLLTGHLLCDVTEDGEHQQVLFRVWFVSAACLCFRFWSNSWFCSPVTVLVLADSVRVLLGFLEEQLEPQSNPFQFGGGVLVCRPGSSVPTMHHRALRSPLVVEKLLSCDAASRVPPPLFWLDTCR